MHPSIQVIIKERIRSGKKKKKVVTVSYGQKIIFRLFDCLESKIIKLTANTLQKSRKKYALFIKLITNITFNM